MEFLIEILKYLIPALLAGGLVQFAKLKTDKKKTLAETHKTEAETHKIEAEKESIEISSLVKIVDTQSAQLKIINERLEGISRERNDCDENYKTLSKEFEQFKKESVGRVKIINNLKKESTNLKNEILKLKNEKYDIEKKFAEMEKQNSLLKNRVNELEKHEKGTI